MDIFDNDLSVAYNLSPAQCCEAYAKMSGCKAYMFVNGNLDATVWYLKSSTNGRRVATGAVSGVDN